MEAIRSDYLVLESGAFLAALAVFVLALGSVLLGRLADEEKTAKWFFWAEWPLPGRNPGCPESARLCAA
jgi:drug/metabolite transporter (DMT)-like permease